MIARIFFLATLMALITGNAHAAARRSSADEAKIGACIRRAASGRSWLEKTLWGLRDQEAGWVGAQILNRNGTHDLGPLQVNSWWVGRLAERTGRAPELVRYWLTHDPCFNIDAARWIFLTALATTGDYWKAIGVYHSPTAWRQKRYSSDVASKLKLRFGPDLFPSDRRTGIPNGVASTRPRNGRGSTRRQI